MTALRAFRVPADRGGSWVRDAWDGGDAALLLPYDAPDATVARTLRRLRPDSLTTVDAHGRDHTERLPDPLPTDPRVALVVATSGSTGEPKGVELGHDALAAATRASLERLEARHGERWALALPTHHVAGLAVNLRSWALGTEPVTAFTREALAEAAADHVSLVPTQLARALESGVDLSGFRTVLLGGAAAPPTLLASARAAGVEAVVSYGMSETGGGCVYDGRPLDGVEVAVGADGRIRLRGAMRFLGYRGDARATDAAITRDGWFVTEDLGRWRDGRLEVLGRADEVVVSGGENVPLPAVTAVLRTHPDVADAVVTARPDPEWGQELVALIVPRDPERAPTLAALREHVGQQLPASHAPRALAVVGQLPRDPLGKLTRTAVDRLARDASAGR
jgi:o-succinylbenzoate---CoA ligase